MKTKEFSNAYSMVRCNRLQQKPRKHNRDNQKKKKTQITEN